MNKKIIALLLTAGMLLGLTVTVVADEVNYLERAGAVYAMTNDPAGNQLVVFDRGEDGLLSLIDEVPTMGNGSGTAIDPLGSQGSLVLTEDNRWLLAVNAGSNEISVFRVRPQGLVLTDKVDSGGEFPVSITADQNLVYVLNAGGSPNITGFFLTPWGWLIHRPLSTRDLGSGAFSQVGFNPEGNKLVVTDRAENEILVFHVNRLRLPARHPVTSPSNGNAPFGFIFDTKGDLLVAEAGSGAVSSYAIEPGGSLRVISPSVANGQAATCWIAENQTGYVFTANTGSGSLSAYSNDAGELELLNPTAGSGNLPIDIGVSINGRFLYALDPGAGAIDMFAIETDGSLTSLGTAAGGFSIFAQGIAVR